MPYFDHIESTANIALAIKINKNQHCSHAIHETLAMTPWTGRVMQHSFAANRYVHFVAQQTLHSNAHADTRIPR
jgi:hypothetical protein